MTDQRPDAAQSLPITESFAETSPANPNWKLFGGAVLEGKCLQLHAGEADSGEVPGTAFLDQQFSATQGWSVEFVYASATEPGQGEGFSFYLIDGDHTTEPGSAEGFGYAASTRSKPSGTR